MVLHRRRQAIHQINELLQIIREVDCHTPVLESTEPKPPYVCPGCLITRIATI
jgi:hypothetical protein